MTTTADRKWIEVFVVELRLREHSGEAIGDAVASVRELLRDTGQSASAAFGSPREYAASLDLPRSARRLGYGPVLAQSVPGLVAFLAFTIATTAWLQGQPLLVSVAHLCLLAVIVAMATLLPLYLRVLLRHRWLLVPVVLAGGTAGILLSVAAPNTPDEAWLVLDPLPWVIATAAVMVSLSAWQTVGAARGVGVDPIREPVASPQASRRGASVALWVTVGTAWLFPLAAAIVLGATALLAA